ncbi:molybdopterin-guanine dinucleotide biosynthesis protein MobB [Peribacillus alkalitolerans]|uniref:molybdopterin-guanine dinucleotide biosynthesis protein MobB n=1 Tax=Peribacillus alkalitolerans TaxID=1550385 RepID=UPI003B845770
MGVCFYQYRDISAFFIAGSKNKSRFLGRDLRESLQILGFKNSGKTTLIQKLIKESVARGYQVGIGFWM